MKNVTKVSLACTMVATIVGSSVVFAQSFESTTCRAGTMTVLAKAEDMIVWSLDHKGVTQGGLFDGTTQHCVGVVATIGGKINANGWCKNVGPKSEDWAVIDWVGSDKPGIGTFTYRYGAGKWKGITGSGTYEGLGQTIPLQAGTYQNCVRGKGTIKLPG